MTIPRAPSALIFLSWVCWNTAHGIGRPVWSRMMLRTELLQSLHGMASKQIPYMISTCDFTMCVLQYVKSIEENIRDAETSGDTGVGMRDRWKRGSSPISQPQVISSS